MDTPLWRHGPFGPKTLCNACGVRDNRRKGRLAAQRNKVRKGAVVVRHASASPPPGAGSAPGTPNGTGSCGGAPTLLDDSPPVMLHPAPRVNNISRVASVRSLRSCTLPAAEGARRKRPWQREP